MNFFETDFEKEKRLRMEKIIQTPQNTEKTPNPKGDAKYPEENWIEFIVNQEGKKINLHTYRYPSNQQNTQDTKAILVMFHGLNSHIGNSAHIAAVLAEKGITTVGFDHRGFGKSEGIAGYVESEYIHLDDSSKFISLMEAHYPGKKIFITGQSMGGMTCFQLGLQFPNRFAGSVLFCPAIKDQKENAKFGKSLAKFVGFIAPKMQTVPQSSGLANKNPQIALDNQEDPYIYKGKVIPGTIRVILNSMEKCEKLFGNYNTPFLVVQGGIDKLVDPDLGKELVEKSPSKDKDLLFYENLWHNIWLEDEIKEITPKMGDWILKRC